MKINAPIVKKICDTIYRCLVKTKSVGRGSSRARARQTNSQTANSQWMVLRVEAARDGGKALFSV